MKASLLQTAISNQNDLHFHMYKAKSNILKAPSGECHRVPSSFASNRRGKHSFSKEPVGWRSCGHPDIDINSRRSETASIITKGVLLTI